jgi:hypothetical protein
VELREHTSALQFHPYIRHEIHLKARRGISTPISETDVAISETEYPFPVDVRDCDVALFEKGGSRMWQCHWKTGSSSIRIEHPSTAFINGNGLPTAKGGLMSDDLS